MLWWSVFATFPLALASSSLAVVQSPGKLDLKVKFSQILSRETPVTLHVITDDSPVYRKHWPMDTSEIIVPFPCEEVEMTTLTFTLIFIAQVEGRDKWLHTRVVSIPSQCRIRTLLESDRSPDMASESPQKISPPIRPQSSSRCDVGDSRDVDDVVKELETEEELDKARRQLRDIAAIGSSSSLASASSNPTSRRGVIPGPIHSSLYEVDKGEFETLVAEVDESSNPDWTNSPQSEDSDSDSIEVEPQWLSQNLEDRTLIDELFWGKMGGRYFEAGAGNGRDASNTFVLNHYFGWSGVLVEASSTAFAQITRLHPGVKIGTSTAHNVALCRGSTPLHFVEYSALGGTATSGILEFMSKEFLASWHPELVTNTGQLRHSVVALLPTVRCVPLSDVLGGHSHYDFFSLDLEGGELEALQTFPFESVTVSVWCIELDGLHKARPAPLSCRVATCHDSGAAQGRTSSGLARITRLSQGELFTSRDPDTAGVDVPQCVVCPSQLAVEQKPSHKEAPNVAGDPTDVVTIHCPE